MLKDYFAKRKSKKFIYTMSQTLAKNYGSSNEYTEGQVKTTLNNLGYGEEFIEVAIGIFCNEKIAKAFGLDDSLIKKYRGYSREHGVGVGSDVYMSGGGAGSDAGGGGE